jgi:Mg2+-importing ATPase
LKAQGRVVGFLGDGINDAAALRAADVGLSVDTAVDIAREAADIVLLDKQLGVVGEGVVEGRATFCNLLKYIRMTASSNFGNVVSVLVASAWLPFLPLLPLQLLVQNLLYDASQIGIPFDRVEPDQLQRPLRWDPKALARFMWCFGPVSSLFDLAAFALMLHVFGADTQDQQALFHSGVFVVGLLTQTLVVHLIRTPGPLGRNHLPSAALLGTTLAVVLIGLWLPTSPLAADFGLQPLPAIFHAWLAALLLAYGALVSAVKAAYVRRFGWP